MTDKRTELTLQLLRWEDQFVIEQMKWARGVKEVGKGLDEASRELLLSAYELGLRQGWTNAVSTLNLHKLLK